MPSPFPRVARRLSLMLLLFCPVLAVGADDDVKPIAIAEITRQGIGFDKEIAPILRSHCTACHRGNDADGSLSLETVAAIREGGDSGPAFVPGKGGESLLVKVAAHREEPIMPPLDNDVNASPLSPEELGLLKRWIDEGGKESSKSAATMDWQPLPPDTHPIRAVALSPDGTWLAFGRGNRLLVGPVASAESTSELNDPATTNVVPANGRPPAHLDVIASLAFSPDGHRLASGGFRTVKIWQRDNKNGAPSWRLERTIGSIDNPGIFGDRVTALGFSPDGKRLATGGGVPAASGELRIWDVASGEPVRRVPDPHSDVVLSIDYSADGKLLATGAADKFAKVFAVDDGKQVASMEGHTHHVLGIAWRKDGKVIASAGADNEIKLWSYPETKQMRAIKGFGKEVTAIDFLGDSANTIAGSADHTVRMHDTNNGRELRRLGGSSDFVYALAITADGKIVIAGGQDGVLRIWNTADGKLIGQRAPTPPKGS
ncbi:WD domain, G-beta repeat [Planctomycetes bacterium Pan216]|uniref:WD domain, G-beta repeat n=1 Tax=Kolteria novifilia TaxID=2527975 RepID=A0A518B009_9BACT|nr:WD domain, G-beta repeat [Planctomycetes bacterium Pan216]